MTRRTDQRCTLPECQAVVPAGEGFRPRWHPVYCCEEHAVEDQQMPAM